jgi:beta-galactosidase/beta-glucuronidase
MYIDGHPRRDFERKDYILLNGSWDFCFDDSFNIVKKENINEIIFDKKIEVPFVYQCKKSGINDISIHDTVWYKRKFNINKIKFNGRIFLNFGAVDYESIVWLNGYKLGSHKGGYTPFKFEITEFVKENDNILTLKVNDLTDCAQPRGKQYWKEVPDRCWYVASTGIWQSVWIENVGNNFIENIKITPDIDNAMITTEIYTEKFYDKDEFLIEITYKGKNVKTLKINSEDKFNKVTINLLEEDYIDEVHYWCPEKPDLYDMKITLLNNCELEDTVKTYFGMRKISCKDGIILLNNRPFYQKLILDQGYWEESDITPPDEEAIIKDIALVKEMGFNGVRKHQKIEDPRFYYWADVMGLVVWGEMPSAYSFNKNEIFNIITEYQKFIERDYNHPSIIFWVPMNESWGIRKVLNSKEQQNFVKSLYYLTKSLDPLRLISGNDGWENVYSDLISIHDYSINGDTFSEKYLTENINNIFLPSGRKLLAENEILSGQPIMLTEFGGIALDSQTKNGNWGYNMGASNNEDFYKRYKNLVENVYKMKNVCGFCYTQLTDVKQEVNGLLDMNHKPKFILDNINKINNKQI